MRFSISGAGRDSGQDQNKNVSGYSFGLTATTIGDITVAIMRGIKVTVTLARAGQSRTLVSTNLFALGMANNPSSMEGIALGGDNGDYIGFEVYLGGVINLRNDDILTLEVDVATAAAGQVVSASTIYGVGVEAGTPYIFVAQIPRTQSDIAIPAQRNVTKVAVVNDNDDFGINSLTGDGKIWEISENKSSFAGHIAEQWERVPEWFAWLVYDGAPLPSLGLLVGIDTGVAHNTWVVFFCLEVTKEVKLNAQKTMDKIVAATEQTFGV